MGTARKALALSAVELISLVGFSFFTAWTFLSFFWLFRDFPLDVPLAVRDQSQFVLFLGLPVGFVALHLLSRSSRFNLFSAVTIGAEILCAVLLPIVAFAMYHNVHVPLFATCAVGFLAGVAGAFLIVSWLDVLSRLSTSLYGRFTGLAFIGGTVLFALAALLPDGMQPVFSFAYVLFSICLLMFATQNADGNDLAAPLENTENTWRFAKEIEPSFFMFGVVFALNFVFLFNSGTETLLFGLLAVIPGALVTVIVACKEKNVDITVVQRVLLVVTVLSCVLLPFSSGFVQIVCACLAVAAWAAFKTVNYAFVVRKSVVVRTTPLFRQAPLRLCVSSAGFAVGWGIAAFITTFFGAHTEPFTTLRLAMAFILVLVVMAFFPVGKHHPADGTAQVEAVPASTATVSVSMDESELFDARCDAIVKLYRLSPRESDVFRFLAKGRNAVWIQETLVVSPHTVKSHIYNIYRKLDIHSQQKLMTFVEEYPLDTDDVVAARRG